MAEWREEGPPRKTDELSDELAVLRWYDRGEFESAPCIGETFDEIKDGFSHSKDIIFLVPGMFALNVFDHLLRYHQKMTPHTGVVTLLWRQEGVLRMSDLIQEVMIVNVTEFLGRFPKDKRMHCIGHDLGAHVCAAVCRQFYQVHGRKCHRIVALSPSPAFVSTSLWRYNRERALSSKDAKYVVVLASNRNRFSNPRLFGHEYITTDWDGLQSDMCDYRKSLTIYKTICGTSYYLKTVCEHIEVKLSSPLTYSQVCSHLSSIFVFMRSLDVLGAMTMFRSVSRPPTGYYGHFHTAWNGYSISKDYRYPLYFDSETSWYATHVGDGVTPYGAVVILSYSGSSTRITAGSRRVFREMITYGTQYELETALIPKESLSRFVVNHTDRAILLSAHVMWSHGCEDDNCAVPMSSFFVQRVECKWFTAYSSVCGLVGEARMMPAYRDMLDVKGAGLTMQVPPKRGRCLRNRARMSGKLPSKLSEMNVTVGAKVDLELSPKHWFFELFGIDMVKDGGLKRAVFSYWDTCREARSFVTVRADRRRGNFQFSFKQEGSYTIFFDYAFEVVEWTCHVSKAPPTRAPSTAAPDAAAVVEWRDIRNASSDSVAPSVVSDGISIQATPESYVIP